jgi:hypothetical protein
MGNEDLVSRLGVFAQSIIKDRDSTNKALQEQNTPAAHSVYRSVLHAYNEVVARLEKDFPELRAVFDEYERQPTLPKD